MERRRTRAHPRPRCLDRFLNFDLVDRVNGRMRIRNELSDDSAEIRRLVASAFPTEAESFLVDELRLIEQTDGASIRSRVTPLARTAA